MDFNENKAIYLQIVEYVFEKILTRQWHPADRVPAVRELAVSLEVNPNTVLRTYQHLENMNVISLKRGTGYYLSDESYKIVFSNMKQDFLNNQLPSLFKTINLLHISPEEIKNLYSEYLSAQKQE